MDDRCSCKPGWRACANCQENARWERIWQERGWAAMVAEYENRPIDPYRQASDTTLFVECGD